MEKEKYTSTIAPPVLTTAPTSVQNAMAIQQAHANNLGPDIEGKNSCALPNDVNAIRQSQECSGGLTNFDYYSGDYLGTWSLVTVKHTHIRRPRICSHWFANSNMGIFRYKLYHKCRCAKPNNGIYIITNRLSK